MSSAKYESWTLTDLKSELKKRSAKQSGRKRDLITRLEFLDASQDKSQNAIPDVEYDMNVPEGSTYKDVHGGMTGELPSFTMARLDEYLTQFAKKLEEKSKSLYNERFLRYLRASDMGGQVFLSAVVWAEMRKSASYKVDISLNTDGVVQEAQCECGAGQ